MDKRIVIIKHSTITSKPKFRTLKENEDIIIIKSKKIKVMPKQEKYKIVSLPNKRNNDTIQTNK